ncbi:MAG: guanylate kinase [Gammaproteobacteria bacterium]|nr:guanylate kinase [Gammaproteobacteria bacterium]
MKTGNLYILSAPSGAGKSSLLQALLPELSGIQLSVSHTTRDPRPGEESGIHYNFTTIDDFQQGIEAGEFLEHAQVFDNFYGTSEIWVRDTLQSGVDVVLEIDWQGARSIRQQIPESISIFILPPSQSALRERLQHRGQDSSEIIERRMRDAMNEMSHYDEYNYLLINNDFEQAREALKTIFLAERLKTPQQQMHHQSLLQALIQQEI